MKLYSYIVTHDTGFAPNPFWGCCTVATCKPDIRRNAQVGEWIIGLSPKVSDNRVIFAMEVDEILDFASYYRDSRFANKIPDYSRPEVVWKAGDNIYKPLAEGEFQQLRSTHSHRHEENAEMKEHDLHSTNVLIARKFHYFGGSGPELPPHLDNLKVGVGHKNHFSQETIDHFLVSISSYPQGVIAPPTSWPASDKSWKLPA